MNKRSIEFAALAIALTFAGACKGRTAVWEEETKTPDSGKTDGGEKAPSSTMEAGLAAWNARAESKDKVLEAIAAWEGALGCKPGTTTPADRCAEVPATAENAEMLAHMTRAYYFTADSYLRSDEAAYLDFMNRAVWWGERALVAASPEFAEKMREKGKYHEVIGVVGIEGLPAMYWYATALGKWARASGFGVLVGQKDNIKATMDRALQLDPNFYHGGPHRYFGAFYAVAPAFAGGDPEKSKEHYEKSLEIAPYFLGTKVLMAENLARKLDDEDMFKRLLQEVIDADINTVPAEILPEMQVEKQKAEELLKLAEEEEWF
ncbi:MAG TPA: TRAP transporter TatT component family protein [Enhygromyxa sp.]|nr:TRAP transporter TatT component family protein [Enhygromyxa sp.]